MSKRSESAIYYKTGVVEGKLVPILGCWGNNEGIMTYLVNLDGKILPVDQDKISFDHELIGELIEKEELEKSS